MARALAAKPRPHAGPKRSLVWLQGVVCGLLATLATPMAVLLCGLLAPGLVAMVLDRAPGRPIARTVLLFGLAASVYPARDLWLSNMSINKALVLISDMSITGTAWAAAAGGWMLAEVTPLAIGFVLDARGRSRAAALRRLRREHAEAWGLPVED